MARGGVRGGGRVVVLLLVKGGSGATLEDQLHGRLATHAARTRPPRTPLLHRHHIDLLIFFFLIIILIVLIIILFLIIIICKEKQKINVEFYRS